jgi:siroheme synthase
LVFITAHRAPENRSAKTRGQEATKNDGADWSKLAASGATLVIYMPGRNYSEISKKLEASGLAGDTPCAIISRATTQYQRVHRTNVLELHRAPQLPAPTLLVVGEVVRLADPAAAIEQFAGSLEESLFTAGSSNHVQNHVQNYVQNEERIS